MSGSHDVVRKRAGVVAALLAVGWVAGCGTSGEPLPAASVEGPPVADEQALAEGFDPARDPFADVRTAVALAEASGRRVILDVGGEWCIWCHALDAFIEAHDDLAADIARGFVWLKINYSPENENETFLAAYPEIPGYPHFFVLERDGTLLHSQNTVELESGESYDLDRFRAFVAQWSPAGQTPMGD